MYRNILFSLEKAMDGYKQPDELSLDFFDYLLEVSDEFYSYRDKAIHLLGSFLEVERQLNFFTKNVGSA